ncbi:MAG: hypothetical protein EKK62_04015 [Acidimicrobiia bacterium]|nr:MAG: hypothetical protein EKK62_04015 [Acidimicrobiia bacterium]
MTAATVRDIVDAELTGQARFTEFVKTVTQTTTAGVWYDLTGAAGNPRAKQWFDSAPLTAAQIRQSTDGGIFHGSAVSPASKYLRMLRLACASATPLPMPVILCDALLYYPTIEDGTTDPQVMDNSLALPRYADGAGVQMMAVTIASRTGGQSFSVSYTNSNGVSGRTTPAVVQNAVGAPGTITTSARATAGTSGGPFLPLQDGDSGVRSVESVTMNGADTGFFAIVLVKPIAQALIRGNDAPYEKDLLLLGPELERVQDDAFLTLLAMPNGSLSGLSVRGAIRTIWS